MYLEQILQELKAAKDNLLKELDRHDATGGVNGLEKYAKIHAYYYGTKNEPGRNLTGVYGISDVKKLVAEIRKDIENDDFTRLNYLDYFYIPSFNWFRSDSATNYVTFKNVRVDLVFFNHYYRVGDINYDTVHQGNQKSVGFQIHDASLIQGAWYEWYPGATVNRTIASLEAALGLTLKQVRHYMGEDIVGWKTYKIILPDEREISHPIMTYSENADNTMWPMALYSICPQYRFKQNDYWLFNQVYGDANRAAYMGKDGVIKKERKTVVKGIPFIIMI